MKDLQEALGRLRLALKVGGRTSFKIKESTLGAGSQDNSVWLHLDDVRILLNSHDAMESSFQ